jgi:hypothetical protein
MQTPATASRIAESLPNGRNQPDEAMKRFFNRNRTTANDKTSIAAPDAPSHSWHGHIRLTDCQPVRTSSQSIQASCPAWHPPKDHAVALLQWMQGPGGRIGPVPASELMKAHSEMCAEHFWELTPWIPVAKALRKLLNDPKHRYASHNSRRAVVYLIPPFAANGSGK